MAFGKSPEEKAADAQAKAEREAQAQRAQAAAQQARANAEFLARPVGQATTASRAGRGSSRSS
jgi:hypothetical protein